MRIQRDVRQPQPPHNGAPPAPARVVGGAARRPTDSFQRQRQPEPDETPFWLVQMATDRMAARQYLSPRERALGATLETRFVAGWAEAVAKALDGWHRTLHGAPALADWQALADALCAGAGLERSPRLVWQPALKGDRGQFLFKLEGSLIQLRPGAAGSLADWVGTVAHETFHHAQQERVVQLYQGRTDLTDEQAALAAYWRDARNVYRPREPGMRPEEHRRQALEVGAWAFGERIGRQLERG